MFTKGGPSVFSATTHTFCQEETMTEYQKIMLTSLSYFIILSTLVYLLLFFILPKPLAQETTTEEPVPIKVEKIFQGSSNDWRYLRKKVFKIQGDRCLKCGKKTSRMHVDHIKPKSRFPHLEYKIDNLQVLCQDCNREKSFDKIADYRGSNHLIALLKEIKSNKLLKRKYTHNLPALEKLTITKFQQDLRKGA